MRVYRYVIIMDTGRCGVVHPEQPVRQVDSAVTIRTGEARTPKPVEPRRP